MSGEPEAPKDLRLITALRYDRALLQCDYNTFAIHGKPSPYLLLPYHYERLLAAAHAHGRAWASAAESLTLDGVQEACRLTVRQHGEDGGPLKVSNLHLRTFLGSVADHARFLIRSPTPKLKHRGSRRRAQAQDPRA